MTVKWTRLDPASRSACYGVSYIMRELEEDDLRQVILRFAGRLAPETANRDKLAEWAAYLFEVARLRAAGRPVPESLMRRARRATDPWKSPMGDHWARLSEKAAKAFKKMEGKAPSPTSAQGLAFKLLDEHGEEMDARGLIKALKKNHGKLIGLNTARSYMSGWRKTKKAKGGGK